ncbi:MAG: hypothetical protein CMF27_05320 [Kiritimatiellaceae bacterium]|nr:hypothetical protein [Kiritimatiellaceae bacterium]
MSLFENVTVTREANVYFDGRVSSRTIEFADGSRKTLGFMQVGTYSFDTGVAEVMEVLGGSAMVQLPGSDAWTVYEEGMRFEVPAEATFALKVDTFMDYCCSYLDA